jgi:hypothetical protein
MITSKVKKDNVSFNASRGCMDTCSVIFLTWKEKEALMLSLLSNPKYRIIAEYALLEGLEKVRDQKGLRL